MNTLFKTITTAKTNYKRRASDKAANVVTFQESPAAMQQKVFIKDMEVMASIGVLEEEKKAKQRIIVNVEATVTPNQNWRDDNINDVISYADIVQTIEKVASQDHTELVETICERVIEKCMKSDDILEMTVRVDKPDIFGHIGSVGAEITRKK